MITFLGPDVADELHLAAPGVEGIQDALGVAGRGVRQDVLEDALLATQPRPAVPPQPHQHRAVEQHEVKAVADEQGQQQREEGQGDGRGHHPEERWRTNTETQWREGAQRMCDSWGCLHAEIHLFDIYLESRQVQPIFVQALVLQEQCFS